MTSLLFKSVNPVIPHIIRSWNKIGCRLCSHEKSDSNYNKKELPADKTLSDSQNQTYSDKTTSIVNDDTSSTISLSSKYISFDDRDAPLILDVEEERFAAQKAHLPKDPLEDVFARISLDRGKNGVFELHELVEVLKLSKARDLCVISVPEEARYVDYMLIVTGKSNRHMVAMAEFVRRVYKQKRLSTDQVPKIEGKTCKNWVALDLGNIALHIFSASAREMYDLESLWAIGPAFDPITHKQEDSIVSLLQRHSLVLDDLHPAD